VGLLHCELEKRESKKGGEGADRYSSSKGVQLMGHTHTCLAMCVHRLPHVPSGAKQA
jgi:hypothetical protein